MRMVKGLALAAGTMMMTTQVFAQTTGNAAQITTFFSSALSWLSTVMGPSVFVLGLCLVGFSMATGNEDSVRKGGYVVAGGALILLSSSVVALLRQLAGV
jgi:type IV secretory pathway VirB2 component (pilin)